jgi:hypothetical protein
MGEHFEPVHLWHPDIQEHEIEGALLQLRQRLDAVLRGRDGELGGPQALAQEHPGRAIVFGDENGAHGWTLPRGFPLSCLPGKRASRERSSRRISRSSAR